MYQIDIKSIQKIVEVNRLLNALEIRGAVNVQIMYNSMAILQEVINDFQKQIDNDGSIVIDNTKEKK
jgi:hypothetical protein